LLDIIVPVPISNVELAPDALTAIEKNTDVPFRVLVMVDGGVRKDFEALEGFLAGFNSSWRLLHNNPSVGPKLTAIIGPEVRLLDPQWFGKVQVVFHRDPICGVADTWPNTKSATLHPVRRAHNNPTSEGCRFAVVQTAFAKKTHPFGLVDPVNFWSRFCMSNGGSGWAVPSVRYALVDHYPHELGKPALVRG
jgi:hypothetical protein